MRVTVTPQCLQGEHPSRFESGDVFAFTPTALEVFVKLDDQWAIALSTGMKWRIKSFAANCLRVKQVVAMEIAL